MTTYRKLWIGFGTQTALLLVLGLTVIGRLQSIESDVAALCNALHSRIADLETTATFHAASETIFVDLRVSRSTVLLMLVTGVAISLATSRRVSKRVVRTEQALAEAHQALEESFALLDRMLSKAPVGLAFVDREYRYLRINESLAIMNGRPVQDHLGRTVAEIVPHLWPALEPMYRQVLHEGRTIVNEEVSAETPLGPGHARHWLTSYYPIFGNDRGVIGVGVVIVEVTAQKRAAELLREADRKKDEFLATLAHELRNPLAPLKNAIRILRRPRDGKAMAATLDLMDRQLGQLVRLVDDLLDVSRITGGKLELRKERVDLAAIVQSAVESSRPLIDARGHELTVTLPAEPVHLDADFTRMSQVLLNLLNNSAKYTGQGGRIWLTADLRGGEVTVRVRDTGIGIPADVLPHVFEMFTQADRTLERTTGGLGIGLTLAKRLVEMHGGTITAHSEGPGRGSELTVRLPVLAEPSPAAPVLGEETSPAPSVRHRILVVDDVADIAESLATILETMGHDVRTAGDGVAALDVGERFRPDVVLLDIGMPQLNGYDTCRRIRELPWGKDAVIVAQTGWGSAADRRRTAEAGFDLHMVKPVDSDVLMKRIDLVLAAR